MDAGAGAIVLDTAVGVETGVGLIAGAGAYAGAVALVCAYVEADAGAGQCTDAGTSARTSAVYVPDLGLVELLPPAVVGGLLGLRRCLLWLRISEQSGDFYCLWRCPVHRDTWCTVRTGADQAVYPPSTSSGTPPPC